MLDYKKAFNDRPALNEAFRRPVEEKKQRRETQFPIDLQNAFTAGQRLVVGL